MKRTTFWTRIRSAWRVLTGKPSKTLNLGIDVKRCSECDRLAVKWVNDPEDPKTTWAAFPDGLRLIIREGKYVGWYKVED